MVPNMPKPNCCTNPDNLKIVEREHSLDAVTVTRRCVRCDRRHYTQHALPVRVALRGGKDGELT